MLRTIPRHEEKALGLPYPVVLIDCVQEEIDDVTGEPANVTFQDMEGLVATLAAAVCHFPVQLLGAEVRFIRRVLGFKANTFAESLMMDPATYSRWENGKQQVGAWADKQVRLAAALLLSERMPHARIDRKAIFALKPTLRLEGTYPHIELRRIAIAVDGQEDAPAVDGEWDYKLAA
jgi:transcriptional regulator with XRE-family HTH domain